MITKWTEHLRDSKDKDEFRKQVLSAKPVLERLRDLIDERILMIDTTEMDPEQFMNPSWPFLQAYNNGYRSILAFTRNVLTLDPKDVKQNDPKPTGR